MAEDVLFYLLSDSLEIDHHLSVCYDYFSRYKVLLLACLLYSVIQSAPVFVFFFGTHFIVSSKSQIFKVQIELCDYVVMVIGLIGDQN